MTYRGVSKIRFHGKNLRILNPELASRVEDQYGEDINRWVEVGAGKFDIGIFGDLIEALPLLAKMTDPEDAMAQSEAMNKVVLDNAATQGKVIAEKNAAIARLEQWGVEQGLLSSDRNVREVKNFIETSYSLPEQLRGKWTVQTVDLAVKFLSKENRLAVR